MNNQETIDHLEGLKLKGMAQTFKASLNMPVQERPTAEQLVGKMAEAELFYRNQRRTEMYLKTSCGKSYLTCALGRQACYLGYRVEYFSMNKFVEKIALSKIDGILLKVINQSEKNDLIILDNFGLQPLDNNSRLALLQILEDCYERKAVIITSQLPIKKWYDYIGEPTLADAIMDRLTSNANRIELKGESMRRKKQYK